MHPYSSRAFHWYKEWSKRSHYDFLLVPRVRQEVTKVWEIFKMMQNIVAFYFIFKKYFDLSLGWKNHVHWHCNDIIEIVTYWAHNNKSFKNEKCLRLLCHFIFSKTLTLTQQSTSYYTFCKTPCNYTKIKKVPRFLLY